MKPLQVFSLATVGLVYCVAWAKAFEALWHPSVAVAGFACAAFSLISVIIITDRTF